MVLFQTRVVFKNLSFLFFCASYIFELFFVLANCVPGLRNLKISIFNLLPVHTIEEGVSFDLIAAVLTGAKSFAWITVQKADNEIFCISTHAYRKFQRPTLNIIEKLSSKIVNFTRLTLTH